ncbi:MAG TPA: immunoglobulin-like domain-containing protein [Actinomycetota bacterium]|nr:immunoglobulin-like domain-containing protein [Actinomycetota bacterium]
MRRVAAVVLMILVGCTPSALSERDQEPSAAASLTVSPETLPFGETPQATLRNEGNVELEYEDEFFLEMRWLDRTWIQLASPLGVTTTFCRFPHETLLLRPGASMSQNIEVCDEYGRTPPLAPGDYRVAKIVRTIAPDADSEPLRIKKVATFEVAQPDTDDVPPPSECAVLCMSDTRVEGGDTVRISFTPPRGYTWGVSSEIHLGSAETLTHIGYLYGWNDDKELRTVWPEDGGLFENVGLGGHASWSWVVPERLEPGIYAIAKDGTRGRPSSPLRERMRVWSVAFEVTE